MASKAKGAASLVEMVQSLPYSRRPTWFDRLEAGIRSDLEELRTAFNEGKFPPYVFTTTLYEQVCKKYGNVTTRDTFSRWLRGGKNG